MSFFNSLNTSASALTAQTLRMDIISQNMTNIDTTRTAEGGPYKRKTVIFEEIGGKSQFSRILSSAMGDDTNAGGVRVAKIVEDAEKGPMEYDPSHPDANADGYLEKPNVNVVEEMVNMISANRAYEANITAINTTKGMIARTLEIGR